MSESTPTPARSDDLPAVIDLAVRLLKQRRHLGFDELADLRKSHGYPVSGEHPYIYRQNECLLAWVGMSKLFWMVDERLRRHPNVRIERAVNPRTVPLSRQLGPAHRPRRHRSFRGAALVAMRICVAG